MRPGDELEFVRPAGRKGAARVAAGRSEASVRLAGRTAMVTGAAAGIGAVYAASLAEHGANVVVLDVRDPAVPLLGPADRILFARADVTSDDDLARASRQAVERFGGIDILINNAAIYAEIDRKKPFDEIGLDEWDRMMAVNVRGVWQCVRAVFPHMRQRGAGRIINVSSTTAFVGGLGLAHYAASKAAVIGLTRALARELGAYDITVNVVAPGLVANAGSRHLNPEAHFAHASQARALKRDLRPEDLVGTILYLASDDSAFVTGQTFVVDGGAVMD